MNSNKEKAFAVTGEGFFFLYKVGNSVIMKVTKESRECTVEKWILETKKADFNAIGKKYNISPVLARIMVNRGVKEEEQIQKYLRGTLEDLYEPTLLLDMAVMFIFVTLLIIIIT